ncbi:MAG TPA: sigma-70 family RNA polymerase sigma factor [Bacteroidales bacterium]|nr:sigma-70 family RNA polymerase sigma factor [Bacteroidales bacterium]
MREYSDKEIIECLRNRQGYVVRFLFDRYLPMIRLMVSHMGGSGEDAKDVFQDGLIIMLEKVDNDEFELTCKFKTFLYCVCENLWKAVLSKRYAATNYLIRRVDQDTDRDFTEVSDDNLYKEILYDSFESLDPVSKKILNLYWQDLSPKDIAERLGYTYGYIRKKKCQSQEKLINKIKNHPQYKLIKKGEEVTKHAVFG